MDKYYYRKQRNDIKTVKVKEGKITIQATKDVKI